MDCCITSLSSHTRFYPFQQTLHECLPNCTSWHSWFSNLITLLTADCRCIPAWMHTYSFDLAYEELVSPFHHFPYISLTYLQSPSVLWLRADPSAVQAPACLLSCRWWLLLSEPQAGSPSCQSSGRSKHSMPVSMTYLDFEDNFESASIWNNRTECLI